MTNPTLAAFAVRGSYFIDSIISDEIARVDRFTAAAELGPCAYHSPESRRGAGDALPCNQLATVHELATELEYCESHFRKETR